MKKKPLLWVGIASAVLIGGGLIWYFSQKKKGLKASEGQEGGQQSSTPDGSTPAQSGAGTTPPSTGSTGTGSAPPPSAPPRPTPPPAPAPAPSSASLPNTPFKSNAEGNKFRAWMAANYPNFRYEGEKLDATSNREGAYNNKYIRRAWQLYGSEYNRSLQMTFAANEKVFINNKSGSTPVWSFPSTDKNASGNYKYLLKVAFTNDFRDNHIGTFVEKVNDQWSKITFMPSLAKNDPSGWYRRNPGAKTAFVLNGTLSKTPF